MQDRSGNSYIVCKQFGDRVQSDRGDPRNLKNSFEDVIGTKMVLHLQGINNIPTPEWWRTSALTK